MAEKTYLYIFLLFAISYQGIAGAFLDNDIGELSNVHVREKRVISRHPDEDVPVSSGVFPYVVSLKTKNRIVGAGTILSPRTVITTAGIMIFETTEYTVTSASTYSFLGVVHNVTDKRTLLSRPLRRGIGISLLYVHPPFEHRNTAIIGLHSGPIFPDMHGTVIGWACSLLGRQQTQHPRRLRAITVPIVSHRECVNIYRSILTIRDEDVCTYHEQKQCGDTDYGAPLVIDNELAGIHIGIIPTPNQFTIKPDIFTLLQHAEYNQWIRSNILY